MEEKRSFQMIMKTRFPLSVVGMNYYLSTQIIAGMIENGAVKNRSTSYVYEHYYLALCDKHGVNPMSHIGFSRFITANFNYTIEDVKRYGKKHRVFMEVQDNT